MPRCARLCSQAGGRSLWLRAYRREHVGAAQRVGQPVPVGHVPDQGRPVVTGHPGRGDEQRAPGGSTQDRHDVGSRAEPGLGDPDQSPGRRTRCAHRAPRLGLPLRPDRRSRPRSAGPASSDRPRPRAAAKARAGRTRPVGRAASWHPGYHRSAFGQHVREGGIGGQHGCRPGRRRSSGNAHQRLRTRRWPGACRLLCLEDA